MTSGFDTVTAVSLRYLFHRRPDLKTSEISHPFGGRMVACAVNESCPTTSSSGLRLSELLSADSSRASSSEVLQYYF